jgi:hypothetical protein
MQHFSYLLAAAEGLFQQADTYRAAIRILDPIARLLCNRLDVNILFNDDVFYFHPSLKHLETFP